jgi:hypothetical protein
VSVGAATKGANALDCRKSASAMARWRPPCPAIQC